MAIKYHTEKQSDQLLRHLKTMYVSQCITLLCSPIKGEFPFPVMKRYLGKGKESLILKHPKTRLLWTLQLQSVYSVLHDDDELFWWYGWPTKGVQPYFHLIPLSEILAIANLRYATSRICTCAEPELRLSWMTFAAAITTTPLPPFLHCFLIVLLTLACSLSHVILLLSEQPITFHNKQLSYSVLRYWPRHMPQRWSDYVFFILNEELYFLYQKKNSVSMKNAGVTMKVRIYWDFFTF